MHRAKLRESLEQGVPVGNVLVVLTVYGESEAQSCWLMSRREGGGGGGGCVLVEKVAVPPVILPSSREWQAQNQRLHRCVHGLGPLGYHEQADPKRKVSNLFI